MAQLSENSTFIRKWHIYPKMVHLSKNETVQKNLDVQCTLYIYRNIPLHSVITIHSLKIMIHMIGKSAYYIPGHIPTMYILWGTFSALKSKS